jgi:hypothetical protein
MFANCLRWSLKRRDMFDGSCVRKSRQASFLDSIFLQQWVYLVIVSSHSDITEWANFILDNALGAPWTTFNDKCHFKPCN